MPDIAEAGIVLAEKTGSYNHNEIVVTAGLDGDEGSEPGFAAGSMNHNEIVVKAGSMNHNEIVVESGARASEPAPKDVEAGATRRAGAIGGNHNEIVLYAVTGA
ncbi:hypothetical protein [Streptomyces antibioticus]|uniref:hypothetical protein n=1 Tax=Streptomyces antibioticus TaxID=1890 RepID=UPI0036896B9A